MTSRVWEGIDAREFNDGVLYVPLLLELQPRFPRWGHPSLPGLRERLANDRPQGVSGEKLLCLLCMRIRAERGEAPAPVWLTYVESRWGQIFRHENGCSPHPEHQPETDIHKALKEREARTFEAAGATSVDVEVWRPRARRRPDVLAVGPELTVAAEIQHSRERPRAIQNRQKSLRAAGDRVVWTTDRSGADLDFLRLVPHLSVPNLGDHRLYLSEPALEIGAGAIMFEEQRCGWADMWNGNSPRCPVTRRLTPCGKWHHYPTYNAREYVRQRAAIDARFPCGPRPHLDHLLEGILYGAWLPYRHRNQITWIPAGAHDRVMQERGGSVEQAEDGTVRRRDKDTERTCEQRMGSRAAGARDGQAGAPAPAAVERDAPAGVCCGVRTLRPPGGPLLPACYLCRASPTYYRRDELTT